MYLIDENETPRFISVIDLVIDSVREITESVKLNSLTEDFKASRNSSVENCRLAGLCQPHLVNLDLSFKQL